MWNDISPVWQTAFCEMWTAFREGSVPIGAVLCDAEGSVILSDRNRNHAAETVNRRIAHAEVNLLRRLDTDSYDPKTLTLYSTMEPCPMCMGTALMAGIRRIRSAARDSYCGMTHLAGSEPYYASKNVVCTFEGGDLELVQLTVQAYFELRHIDAGAGRTVFEAFASHCPQAAETAGRLYAEKLLDDAAGADISDVFDRILREIHGTNRTRKGKSLL